MVKGTMDSAICLFPMPMLCVSCTFSSVALQELQEFLLTKFVHSDRSSLVACD